jgi:hypothetical protein
MVAAFAPAEGPAQGVAFAFRLVDVVDDGIVNADIAEDTIVDVAALLDEMEETPMSCQ